jgi:hypothetical protein
MIIVKVAYDNDKRKIAYDNDKRKVACRNLCHVCLFLQEMGQMETENRFPKTASGPESSFSLTRQAQKTNRYDRRIRKAEGKEQQSKQGPESATTALASTR